MFGAFRLFSVIIIYHVNILIYYYYFALNGVVEGNMIKDRLNAPRIYGHCVTSDDKKEKELLLWVSGR